MQPSGREMQGGGQDDFFDQMLSTLPAAWSDLGSGKSPWELPAGAGAVPEDAAAYDEATLLASRLRHHQIGGGEKPLMLHLSDLHGLGGGGGGDDAGFMPLPLFTDRARDDMDAAFKSPNAAVRSFCSAPRACSRLQSSRFCPRAVDVSRVLQGADQALYNGFGAAGIHAAAVHQPPFGQVRRWTGH